MKKAIFSPSIPQANKILAFSAAILLVLLVQASLGAQITATWKGGTPGRNSDWNCLTNWKEGRVPNEFSNVLIPDVSASTFSYPVIEQGEVEILTLQCAPTAHVTIRKLARVIVIEPSNFEGRIQNASLQASESWDGKMVMVGN